MKEQWRKTKYRGYMVSNKGRVVSLARKTKGRNLKRRIMAFGQAKGYPSVMIPFDGAKGGVKSLLVHRLVGVAFVPNPQNKPHINHKDGDKRNNHACNLEWVTPSENLKWSYDILGFTSTSGGDPRPVVCFVGGYKFKEWGSISAAAKEMGCGTAHLVRICKGIQGAYNGIFDFQFKKGA